MAQLNTKLNSERQVSSRWWTTMKDLRTKLHLLLRNLLLEVGLLLFHKIAMIKLHRIFVVVRKDLFLLFKIPLSSRETLYNLALNGLRSFQRITVAVTIIAMALRCKKQLLQIRTKQIYEILQLPNLSWLFLRRLLNFCFVALGARSLWGTTIVRGDVCRYTQLNITNSLKNHTQTRSLVGQLYSDAQWRKYCARRHTHTHVNYNIRTSAYDVLLTPPLFGLSFSLSLTGKLTINIPVENFTGSVGARRVESSLRERRDDIIARARGVESRRKARRALFR